MRIFDKKKQENTSGLYLMQVQEKKQYDFFAALAKALLLFLLVYGALGGFLAAFEIEYNKGLCMLALFVLALALSAAYETGKRWLTNIISLGLFALYFFVAISNYWAINSGYYAVLNRIFEEARAYLDISGGVEYSMVVQDEYATVTLFVVFLGMVGVILLNIQMQNKCSLLKTMLLTFTPYIVPLYLKCVPPLIYILFLFTGYAVIAVIQNGNVRERLSGQMRYVLPMIAVVVMLTVRMMAFVIPEEQYGVMVPDSTLKESTKESMGKFAQYGMSALFQNSVSGAGMSGGKLSRGAATMPSYETDLLVRYTPYSFDGMYLKAFTGKDYTGTRWTIADEEGAEDGRMENSVQSRKSAYEQNRELQGKGVMEIEYVGADLSYEYQPYYTDYEAVRQTGKIFSYTYYPAGSTVSVQGEADVAYLSVPDACKSAVEEICADAGFGGSSKEIALQIVNYFQENYSYTLRPGFYYGNPDYISHFLLESKKGYCSHFASAGTMLFRNMGIPARYVEGYAFSYTNVVEDGLLVENAVYEDYYDGYSAMGETALIEMEIPDAYAHAWVEIYVEGEGWIVVDPTPASTEEDTTSFWDAFMTMGEEGEVPQIGEQDFGTYLETALSGTTYLLLGATIVVLVVLMAGYIIRMKRENAMSGKERVLLEYSRLQNCLVRKNKEHRKLRTPAQLINCVRMQYELEITDEQEQALYQALFAPQVSYDCQKLCKELAKVRKVLRRKKANRNY